MHREGCPDSGDKFNSANNHNKAQLENYHLYYNAVDCAEKVLSSSFISISFAFLIVIASLLF